MFGTFLLIVAALRSITLQKECYSNDEEYYELAHFWTNIGLCPAGSINHKEISTSLNSDAMSMNLRHIAALPKSAVTHVRIHWLLELVQFVQFTQAGVPIYDFSVLDQFLENIDDLGLYPVVEFMANPGNVFEKNPTHNYFYWEDFGFQVARHYLNKFGAAKLLRWQFETWNEPDLVAYNRLNFTVQDYLTYVTALRSGLTEAGRRNTNNLYFRLRGPAGLFKSATKHPLCWKILEFCSVFPEHCPLDILTYHRKGDGHAQAIIDSSSELLQHIYSAYPSLKNKFISNDEADPTTGWSIPMASQADVRYAVTLIKIVMEHWDAKLNKPEFSNLKTISHDNGFLSYHPFEFTQRTLLAHFRMNETQPTYSQFIQKPVYTALGLLSKLGTLATEIETIHTMDGHQIKLFKTKTSKEGPMYLSWLFVSEEHEDVSKTNFTFVRNLLHANCTKEIFFIVELLEQKRTDPHHIWLSYGAPAYPNSTVRNAMRHQQAAIVHSTGNLTNGLLLLNFKHLNMPWTALLRACSSSLHPPLSPRKLIVTEVTKGEVLLTWREFKNTTQCLRSYEVWYRMYDTDEWFIITAGWHIPFPIFQYAPIYHNVSGFYKVRGVDLFNRTSTFSQTVEYYEI